MSGQTPFRERRLSPEDARRIVERAVALGARRPADDGGAPALTEAELAHKLAELGLPEDVIRTAMAAPAASTSTLSALPRDAALRVVHESTIEGAIPPERHEDLADAVASVMGSRGRVEVVGSKLTWTPGGALAEPALTVRSKDGRTHFRVEETIANQAQVAIGSITAAVFAAMFATGPGIGLAKMLGAQPHTPALVAFVIAFVMMWAGAAMFGARRLFRRRHRHRDAALRVALQNVEATARGMVAASAQVANAQETRDARVRVEELASGDHAALAARDAAADAEADAAAAEAAATESEEKQAALRSRR